MLLGLSSADEYVIIAKQGRSFYITQHDLRCDAFQSRLVTHLANASILEESSGDHVIGLPVGEPWLCSAAEPESVING